MTNIIVLMIFLSVGLLAFGEGDHPVTLTHGNMKMRPVVKDGECMDDMPQVSPKRVYTVTGKEDFSTIEGYGREDGMISMMNLMMVEGSSMENMDMSHMPMAASNDDDPLAPENIGKYSKTAVPNLIHRGH